MLVFAYLNEDLSLLFVTCLGMQRLVDEKTSVYLASFFTFKQPSRRPSTRLGTFGETQFLIKRVGLGLSAQELNQRLHLVLAASLFEHRVSVPATLLGIHRVLSKDTIKHVCRVDLRAEVTIVTCTYSRQ